MIMFCYISIVEIKVYSNEYIFYINQKSKNKIWFCDN